jgi:IS5 family transposase
MKRDIMQTPQPQNHALLLTTEEQLFATVVTPDHPFRKLNAILDFDALAEPLREQYSDLGTTGIDVEKGFKALLIQFWEDYSDREMERCLRENLAVRWFCGFSLTETTPDYSYFSKLRTRLGTKRIADTFNDVNATLEDRGLFGNVFHFIDASAIITKTALWEERDRAIRNGEETLNNAVVARYAADTDARWGAKSKHHLWFGYKKHTAVDMRFGLIEKTTVTAANVLDFQVIGQICPSQGMVFTDKLYDTKKTDLVLRAHGCAVGTIRKNTNSRKDRDLDRWRSGIRMPFEGTFSKLRKRARYRGLLKMHFQNFFEAIVHNLKKALTILPQRAAPA